MATDSCAPKRMVLHVVDAASLVFVLILQGSILNYYIIAHYMSSVNPYFWFIADFACLFVFTGTLTISYQYLTNVRFNPTPAMFNLSPKRIHRKFPTSKLGILPLSYVSWMFYSIIHLSKVVLIFKSSIPYHLKPHEKFGPQLLQVTIAMSGIIFFLLVEGHNWAPRNSPRYTYVTSVCGKTAIEILDTVNFLAILFVQESPKTLTLDEAIHNLDNTILVLCSFNFFLPALALYKLSLSDVTCETLFLPINVVYNLLHLCAIDIPFLVVRMYLWLYYNHSSSIFLMKNVFGIIFVLRGTYPDLVELLHRYRNTEVPDRCDSNGGVALHSDDNIELHPVQQGSPKDEGKMQTAKNYTPSVSV